MNNQNTLPKNAIRHSSNDVWIFFRYANSNQRKRFIHEFLLLLLLRACIGVVYTLIAKDDVT